MTAMTRDQKRYEMERSHGLRRSVPIEDVRPAVVDLATRYPIRAIATAAGLDFETVRRIHAGRRKRVSTYTAERLLALRTGRMQANFVAAEGTHRRIRALMLMGWRHDDISEALVRHGGQMWSDSLLNKGRRLVRDETARAVAAAFAELSMQPGPSAVTARRAKAAGYAPPLAWDDIDNPLERPKGIAS